jgi:hypothetical protein
MAVIKGTATVPPPIRAPTRIFWGEYDPILTPSRTDRLGGFFMDLEFSFAHRASQAGSAG